MKPLVLGSLVTMRGDITTNAWVGARSARALEQGLGFGSGRLSAGWWILVLKQKLASPDFKFSGTTLRSGGRYGLPAANSHDDKLRPRIDAEMLREYGADGVEQLKKKFLARAAYEGPDRIVKIVPVTSHSNTMAPSEQYPMGGGGGQWTLIRECAFLVAVQVDANGIARTPSFSVFLGESAAYDERAKLERYIRQA